MGLPYNIVPVDIAAGDQFQPEFLEISPNNKTPAIVDGALGADARPGHHFRRYAPGTIPYAVERYTTEAARLYRVIDRRLAEIPFIAGDEYTIVDMAIFPWLRSHENQGQNLDDYPNLKRWYDGVETRPAVRRALDVGKELRRSLADMDEETDAQDSLRRRTGPIG